MLRLQIISTKKLSRLKDDLQKSQIENFSLQFKLLLKNLTIKRLELNKKSEIKLKVGEPFKIRVTPSESKGIQLVLFKNGIFWANGNREVSSLNDLFLFVENGSLYKSSSEYSFKTCTFLEITVKQFLQTYLVK
jgi:hypothetical protein